MEATTLKQLIIPVLEKYQNEVVFAYLFGSAAKGQYGFLSDVDIALYLKEDHDGSYYDLKFSIYADLCRVLKRNDIDILILNRLDNTVLLESVIREGMLIYEREAGRYQRKEFEVKELYEAIDFRYQRRKIMGV
jgi:uncharacterized protein